MTPFELLSLVTFLICLQKLVNFISKPKIAQFLWLKYISISKNAKLSQLTSLKQEHHKATIEKNSISPQDQYAKWTKLNRKLDKLNKDIELSEQNLVETQQSFNRVVNIALFTLFNVPLYLVRFWNFRKWLFYLPNDVFPSKFEWFLALPRSPTGSIGLTVWCLIIGQFFTALEFIFNTLRQQDLQVPETTTKISTTEK